MEFKRGGDGGGRGKEKKLDFHYRQAGGGGAAQSLEKGGGEGLMLDGGRGQGSLCIQDGWEKVHRARLPYSPGPCWDFSGVVLRSRQPCVGSQWNGTINRPTLWTVWPLLQWRRLGLHNWTCNFKLCLTEISDFQDTSVLG